MTDQDALRVMFMCTANMCRSPLAAAIFKLRAVERRLPVMVNSSGLLKSGVAAHPFTVAAMEPWGVDVSGKVSQRVTPELMRGADLVIGFESRHVRRAIGEDPVSRPKVFLFKELVELSTAVASTAATATADSARDRLRATTPLRHLRYVEDEVDYEIPDPIGEPATVYSALRDQLSAYTDQVLANLFGPAA